MLGDAPNLADKLYGILLRKQPVPDDFGAVLSEVYADNGDSAEAPTVVVGF